MKIHNAASGILALFLLHGCNVSDLFDWDVSSGNFRDMDLDKVDDRQDNCPEVANHNQQDFDGDEVGDLCDPDKDNDFIPNDWETRFGLDPMAPEDASSDGDLDGLTALQEFELGSYPTVADMDQDGLNDGSDNCLFDKNSDQADLDMDGLGDACDEDIDGDGYSNAREIYKGSDPHNASEVFTQPEVTRLSVTPAGLPANGYSHSPAISDDASLVAFASASSNLIPEDNNGLFDVFIADTGSRSISRVSQNAAGVGGNGASLSPVMSSNGKTVAFHSEANNLVPADDNNQQDVFVHRSVTGRLEIANISSNGYQTTMWASYVSTVSPGGESVYFNSNALNLEQRTRHYRFNLFERDLDTATTRKIVPTSNASAAEGGRLMALESGYPLLVSDDENSVYDIFLYDRQEESFQRITVSPRGPEANAPSFRPDITADGNFVVFESDASNLVRDDSNSRRDIFFYDVSTGVIERISRTPHGGPANGDSYSPSVSSDGRFVAFSSDADNLVQYDYNNARDVFIFDRHLNYMRRVSASTSGVQGDRASDQPALSGDGNCVAFSSSAGNLDALGDNRQRDIYLYCREPLH